MGAVNTTYTFTATDTITSTKMNNIIDETVMTADALLGGSGGSGGLSIADGKLTISSGAINSSRLAASSVSNTNVSDTAAIAGTKISPNFGSQNIITTGTSTTNAGSVISGSSTTPALRITQTGSGNSILVEDSANPDSSPFAVTMDGRVCVGDDQSHDSYLPGFTTNYHAAIQGTGASYQDGAWMSLSQYSTSTTDSGGSFISLNKSNNATKGSHTIVTNNQQLGAMGWAGSNGTTFSGAANISVDVDGVPTSTSVPGRLIFSTTPVGGTIPTEKMRIDNAGNVGIGTASPKSGLHVYGSGQATANITDSGNENAFLRISDSSTSAGSGGGIIFASSQSDDTGAVGMAAIKALLVDGSSNTAGDLAFSTRNSSSDTELTERMRIQANGNVGIGKTPTTKLDVNGTVTATAFVGAIPSGAIMPFAMNSVPSGWLAANGAAVSRTTYDDLFAAIGITYGAGNGSTTFNVPDLRGYFVRGSGTNSDGTVSGTFGAKQADAFEAHTHDLIVGQRNSTSSGGEVNSPTQVGNGDTLGTSTANITSTGGTETRPRNIAMLYCIKI